MFKIFLPAIYQYYLHNRCKVNKKAANEMEADGEVNVSTLRTTYKIPCVIRSPFRTRFIPIVKYGQPLLNIFKVKIV